MRRQVDYHLAHARAAASGAALHTRSPVAVSVDGLTRTMRRLHAQRGLTIDARVDPAHAFRGRREDLDEMLGNLLDNACKWAATRVAIESAVEGERLIVTIDDDGPGLEASMREAVLQRGVRADEAAPGSGLGLAIVRELAGLYRRIDRVERLARGRPSRTARAAGAEHARMKSSRAPRQRSVRRQRRSHTEKRRNGGAEWSSIP